MGKNSVRPSHIGDEGESFIKKHKALFMLLIKIASIITVVVLAFVFLVGVYPVHGNYMFPVLRDGDLVLTLKVGGYERGQIVAYENSNGTVVFARIVAKTGDEVVIKDDLTINGQVPVEDIYYETSSENAITTIVPEECVYLLNDYRLDNNDSRTYGAMNVNDLNGHVVFLFRWRSF